MANNNAITFEITIIQARNLAPMDKEFVAIGKKTSSDVRQPRQRYSEIQTNTFDYTFIPIL